MSDENSENAHESEVEVSVGWSEVEHASRRIFANAGKVRRFSERFEFVFASTGPVSDRVDDIWVVQYNRGVNDFQMRNESFLDSLLETVETFDLDPSEAITNLGDFDTEQATHHRVFATFERSSFHGPDAEFRFAFLSPDKLQDCGNDEEIVDAIVPVLSVALPTTLMTHLVQQVVDT